MIDFDRDGYYLICPDHEDWHQVPFTPSDSELLLEDLQTLVGGYIETVFISAKADGIVNEEGKLMGLRPNRLATELYSNSADFIVGNMIILCGKARLS